MSQQFSNAARTELAAGILAGDTAFTLDDGQVFPDANNGNAAIGTGTWFKATLQDPDGIEIVYVRTHNSGTTPDEVSHVLRGQEGTTARAFAAGTAIGLRVTAGDMANLWATMATKAAASHAHTIANVTDLDTALAGKAANNVTLTDAAGTATLPDTSSATVASRLQVLRNNVKQAFADLGTKQATLVSGTNIKTVGGISLLGYGDVPVGGGGGGSLPVQSISANTTATNGNAYVMTASLTLTLPASPAVDDQVGVINASGTTTCVIARNGALLMGLAENMTVDRLNVGFTLVYTGASKGWWVR